MKILHTSDWHLGKNLNEISRMDEQVEFLEELKNIIIDNNIELLLIAGDIYDTFNPPSRAETMFFEFISKITKYCVVVAIGGNHDSPMRLMATAPIALGKGLIMTGFPNTKIPEGDYDDFSITKSIDGAFRMSYKDEEINFVNMAFPNEQRLNEIMELDTDIKMQKTFTEKIEKIVHKRSEEIFTDNGINIFMGHFFVISGVETDSEREVQLGGSLAINNTVFPEKADYVALGHLHRSQGIKYGDKKAYFSGSPIQYSFSEANQSKSVNIFDSKTKELEKVYLRNYKPVEKWKADSIEEAIQMSIDKKDESSYVALIIYTNEILTNTQIKTIKENKNNIMEIRIVDESEKILDEEEIESKSMKEEFIDYYKSIKNEEPDEELLELFLKLSDIG